MGIVPLQRLPNISQKLHTDLCVRGWVHEWITDQLAPSRRSLRPDVLFDAATVTDDYLVALWYKQDGLCALSGRPMFIPNWRVLGKGSHTRHTRHAHNASVDRIDSRLPYGAGNLQLVCYAVNVMKSNFSDEEFIAWCTDVVKTRTEKFTAIG